MEFFTAIDDGDFGSLDFFLDDFADAFFIGFGNPRIEQFEMNVFFGQSRGREFVPQQVNHFLGSTQETVVRVGNIDDSLGKRLYFFLGKTTVEQLGVAVLFGQEMENLKTVEIGVFQLFNFFFKDNGFYATIQVKQFKSAVGFVGQMRFDDGQHGCYSATCCKSDVIFSRFFLRFHIKLPIGCHHFDFVPRLQLFVDIGRKQPAGNLFHRHLPFLFMWC